MRGTTKAGRVLVFWLLASSAGAGPGPAPLAVAGGPYAVGTTVLEPSLAVWYPARGPGERMTYGDYVDLALRDAGRGPGGEPRTRATYVGFLRSNGVAAAGIDAWLAHPMAAVRGSTPEAGRFPIVLIAPGNGGAVHDEAALGEFLASHGFLAAVTPSPGWRGRAMESEADVYPVAEEQAGELAAALDRVAKLPQADPARWAAVGYSFGARAALLLAERRPGMRALVSLAGGIASAQGRGWLPAGAFDRSAVKAPILHVYDDADPAVPPDFTLLESLRNAPHTLQKVPGLGHLDLVTYGLASARLPALRGKDADALDARIAGVFESTRAFLDAKMR
jgi:dienelactone hydrolase